MSRVRSSRANSAGGRLAVVVAGVAAAALALSQVVLAVSADDLQAARSESARFNSLGRAAEAGYGPLPEGVPLHECIAALDGSGAMGFHWLNPSLLDTTLDPVNPEVLVFAPDGHGNLKLVALEYVVFQEPWIAEHGATVPELFGRPFDVINSPNRYELPGFFALHAWLWEPNPDGVFNAFNAAVSCEP
jgi:hypothetical protein